MSKTVKALKKKLKTGFALALLKAGKTFRLNRWSGTSFARDFSAVNANANHDNYLHHQEVCDADEPTLFDALKQGFAKDSLTGVPSGGAKNNPDYQDPHWGNTSGFLQGSLSIDELTQLPPELRIGLFEHLRDYELICRPNYLYDSEMPVMISRMSLKLKYPESVPNVYATSGIANELDLLLSEGLVKSLHDDQDGQGFFFRDARQMLMAITMRHDSKAKLDILLDHKTGELFKHWRKLLSKNTDNLYGAAQQQRGWAGKHYFSAGPYALGPAIMKFALRPLQQQQVSGLKPTTANPAAYHRQSVIDYFADGQKAEFEFCVQIATADSIQSPQDGDPPKQVMATEYNDLTWDEDNAPFWRVGKVTLNGPVNQDKQPGDNWYQAKDDRWYSAEQHQYAVRFNAWNTFEQTRPLGQLFRARKSVHGFHRETRMSHCFGDTPQPGTRCPFSSQV